jgi:uncharacterized cupredoxin-like copper-binding protein
MNRTIKRVAVLLAAVAAAALVALPIATAKTNAGTTVNVKATSSLKFILSTKTAKAGTVTFKVTNTGAIPHDFKIAGKKTPLIAGHKSATLKVTLKKGKYPYLCTVPGHAPAGMKGVFTVK